jgi:hypothetical protein
VGVLGRVRAEEGEEGGREETGTRTHGEVDVVKSVVSGSVDVVLERVVADHVRVVDLRERKEGRNERAGQLLLPRSNTVSPRANKIADEWNEGAQHTKIDQRFTKLKRPMKR